MAKKNKNVSKPQAEDEVMIDIFEEGDYKENFLDKYQDKLLMAVAAILIIVAGYFAYKYLMLAPKEKEAMAEMSQAELQFEKDSFTLALDNPGEGYMGFLDIIDEYSGTKAANTAKYYAGISYLNLGMYDAAIEYLKDYDEDELLTAIPKYGALGDAYSELEDYEKAKSYYEKAVEQKSNELLTPYYLKKLGMLYRADNKKEEANKYFKRIKAEFPRSAEAKDIDKFIAE